MLIQLISSSSAPQADSDEDFGILLDAIVAYDAFAASPEGRELPNISFLITGKGPQRNAYMRKLKRRPMPDVHFVDMARVG